MCFTFQRAFRRCALSLMRWGKGCVRSRAHVQVYIHAQTHTHIHIHMCAQGFHGRASFDVRSLFWDLTVEAFWRISRWHHPFRIGSNEHKMLFLTLGSRTESSFAGSFGGTWLKESSTNRRVHRISSSQNCKSQSNQPTARPTEFYIVSRSEDLSM